MGVASRAATPITVASPLQRHGSRGDVARKSGPTSRTVTRRGASLLAWGAAFFLSTKEEKKASVGCETCACTRPSARWTASGVPGVGGKKGDCVFALGNRSGVCRKACVVRGEASGHGASSEHLVYIRPTPRRGSTLLERGK